MENKTILSILSFAIRAPSTHNSQPWLFKLTPSGVSVFYDKTLLLPEADKDGRDLYISIGCMLENMRISASQFGFEMILEMSINELTRHIADAKFKKIDNSLPQDEKLFKQITKRVNARGIFMDEVISDSTIKVIESIVSEFKYNKISLTILNNKDDIYKIATFTQNAIHSAYSKLSFRKEMSKWMNSNLSNKKDGIPGYSLNMSLFTSMLIPFLIRYFNIGKFLGKLNLLSIKSAPVIVILSAVGNTPEDWINIGILGERLMLTLQADEFQTSIFVGSIEVDSLYTEVQQLIKNKEERPQFIFGIGHINGKHKITPRHQLYEKIIN